MQDITAEWLRQRFAEGHRDEAQVPESGIPQTELTPAAVLVPVVMRPEGLTVLLTKRTPHLRDHAGQVSFPGGRCEPEDASAAATALREAHEEVGLSPAHVEILGNLPEYDTGTGFRVVPVVGLVQPNFVMKMETSEVAAVFEPPLSFLLDRRNHQRHRVEARGKLREFWAMPWEGYYIWGATAGMLVSLHHFLIGIHGHFGD